MIIELNEQNYNDEVPKHEKILIFFYREKGCSFCDKMKPVVEEYSKNNVVGYYKLGQAPDSITEELVQRFPTFVAYYQGNMVNKKEGVMTPAQLDQMFVAKPQEVKIQDAPLVQLLQAEAELTDQVFKLRSNLIEIKNEIKRRKNIVESAIE